MKGKAKAKRGISHIKDARMIQNLKKHIKEKADSDPTQESGGGDVFKLTGR